DATIHIMPNTRSIDSLATLAITPPRSGGSARLVRPTPALTRGPRRARALSADLITRLRPRASKARDRPDRRVERVVMGRGCQHDHNLHASPRVPPAATNNADRCAVEWHRTSPDPGAPCAWQPTREACRHPGHRA